MTTEDKAVEGLIAKLKAGLEGVTPGPWVFGSDYLCRKQQIGDADDVHYVEIARALRRDGEQWNIDAAHIANCSPDNIALLLSTLEAERARAARMEEALRRTLGCSEALCVLLNPQLLPAGAEQQLEATREQNRRARQALEQQP